MPVIIGVAGRHEGQLVGEISKPRWNQPIDHCFALAPRALIVHYKQVHGGLETQFNPASGWRIDALGQQTLPSGAVSFDRFDWSDLDGCAEEIASGWLARCKIRVQFKLL